MYIVKQGNLFTIKNHVTLCQQQLHGSHDYDISGPQEGHRKGLVPSNLGQCTLWCSDEITNDVSLRTMPIIKWHVSALLNLFLWTSKKTYEPVFFKTPEWHPYLPFCELYPSLVIHPFQKDFLRVLYHNIMLLSGKPSWHLFYWLILFFLWPFLFPSCHFSL